MRSTGHTSAAGELFVSQYFLSQGFEVFRNVAPAGPADLIVFNPDSLAAIPVDVKSFRSPYTKKDGTYTVGAQPRFREDGVWVVTYVHGEATVRLPEGIWEALGVDSSA
jgi:hypothetical protein